ncbi:unnamed protein product [Blepharisma stoltei]|uniref:Mitochondrial import inner membrane translocase subunit TIM50 n=1 Tax=Blepharisma stoltei TaxID=1481888 RepID=A0AAU9K4Y7_9CILI|nr:unnamed protein product [Blepharisma stoltei]
MLVFRRRIIPFPLKRFVSSDDDDVLFANDKIESKHNPKSNSPFRIALRVLGRIVFYGSVCLYGYTYYTYKHQQDPENQMLINPYFLSAVKWTDTRVKAVYSLFVDPPLDKLLPDLVLPPGYMKPKTLVLDLRGTLVSTEYVFGKGFEVMKRPGLSDFLNRMARMYEVVIFSDEETFLTSQLTDSLDPRHMIFTARLGKECLAYRSGEFIKDLDYLNRDLKNVIIIEKDPARVKKHPDNAILLPEFKGDVSDNSLPELTPFLEHLVKDNVQDIREELNKYGHTETGKKYLKKIAGLRDQVLLQQRKGLGGFLSKNKTFSNKKANVEPLEDLVPKPGD